MATLNLASVSSTRPGPDADRVAITCGPQQLTYAEPEAKALQVAAGSTRWDPRGDHVAPSVPERPVV